MPVDRYVKIVLTIIALELFWIGIRDSAPPVAAQAQAGPSPAPIAVIIRGIQLPPASNDYLPVGVVGQPVRVEIPQPVKIEADRPLRVESVPYTPSARPGQ
jgi:hypothetical protein